MSVDLRAPSRKRSYEGVAKRIFDLLIAAPVSLLLTPIALLIGIAVRVEDRGPAIFHQQRVGVGGRLFILRKFRTMPPGTPDIPSGEAQALRVTRVGRFLRRTSLDEIPQLLSILKGDMSVVGPRPAIPQQQGLIELRAQNGSLRVKPGLTGLAQVNSYDGMPESEKARWDGEYAKQVSLLLDCRILLRTVGYLTHKPPQY